MMTMVPTIIGFVFYFGAVGGAAGWLLLHMFYVLLAVWMMGRFVGNRTGWTWLVSEIGIPFGVCVAVGMTAAVLLLSLGPSRYVRILLALLSALTAFVLTFAISPLMRHRVLHAVYSELGSLRRHAQSNV